MVAQFVGCYVAKQFRNMLLIDDDCLLPPNFPIVTDRFTLSVKCVGYTIKSVGTSSSKGTLSQQAQDVEIQYEWDSASICWQDWISYLPSRSDQYLGSLNAHQNVPGSSGFLGVGGLVLWTCCAPAWLSHPDVYCRFVETETPDAIFFSGGGDRGGFGEMTIWKQRFFRWNFFFISGIYYDL